MWSCPRIKLPVALLALVSGLFVPALLRSLDLADALNQYGRQTWQTENGLPQDTVHAIAQTRDGYLWLGTEGGLVRFDGLHFAVYDVQNTSAFRSDNVRSLIEDGQGSLWIATTEGILRYRGGEFQAFNAANGLPSDDVRHLMTDRSGRLWAETSAGPAQFKGTRFEKANLPGSDNSNIILGNDHSGRLWLAAGGTLAPASPAALVPASTAKFPAPLVHSKGEIAALAFDRDGKIWIGTEDGLDVSSGSGPKHLSSKDGLPGNRITALLADREGAMWIGTESGLARIANGKVDRLPSNDALSNNAILSLFEDREGNVWAGTDSNGVTILRNQKFVSYAFGNGVSDDQIRCVFEDRSGVVWVGTNKSGLRRYENGSFSKFTTVDGLSSNVILALAQDAKGDLLVGTPDGLNEIHGKKVRVVTSADGLAEDFVRSIYAEEDGALWIGTRRGLTRISGAKTVTYTSANGLGNDLVGALLRDRAGDLWIGTLHGLTRYRQSRFINFTTKDGLSGNVITDLFQDADGWLWIATQDGGLTRYHDGSFQRFGPQSGMPETIYGMAEDSNRNLWLAAKTGIYQVKRESLTALTAGASDKLAVISYGTSDGLRVRECSGGGHPAVWRDHRGAIWFSTAKGAAVLGPAHSSTQSQAPPVVLQTVSIDDQAFAPLQVKEIPPGHSRLSFEYAGLNFAAPQKVEFKYMLSGFDRNWVDAGTRRIAYYTNVPPGRYRFRVTARNGSGIWNEAGASLEIEVRPHFYQTWWFHSILALLAALSVYVFYLWRLKRAEKEFNLVLGERNRIAREIHDTLAQGFVGVSVQLELVNRLLAPSEKPRATDASSDLSASTGAAQAAKEHLDRARTLVREYLAEARESIWELRSQGPNAEDFVSRFSKLARQASDSSGVKVQVEVHGINRRLSPQVEDELFRIGQEAVMNAIRHSGARRITIDLTFGARRLKMTVMDDGSGFSQEVNSSGPDGHYGLKGMRERAEHIHAQLMIESLVGTGTTISVEAPAK